MSDSHEPLKETKDSQPEPLQNTEEIPSAISKETLPNNLRILKEAFPNVDTDVIEAILQSQNDNVDSSFELLLVMSDPEYQPTPPPMPPRPQTDGTPYAYWKQDGSALDDQLRRDEEYAKQIALEDERKAKLRQQPRKEQSKDEDDSIFNFQEELPIIKEKVKEAGNAAKRKMLDFYNQLKASRSDNSFSPNHSAGSSSIPATNAQYKGLSSDDGDDLLAGDVSALHLSDYDVYTKTSNMLKSNNNEKPDNLIHVNPPSTANHTSTSDAQLKADEDFARQLAEEDKLKATRRRQLSTENNEPPQMPSRKQGGPTVVIAPKSPLELGDSDYEDIGLNAASNKPNEKSNSGSVPYVIGDDEDSDSEDLVDATDLHIENKADKSPKEVVEQEPTDQATTKTSVE